MKVVIAGSSGFIGSALTAHLQSQGYSVIGLKREKESPFYWNPEEGKIDKSLFEGVDCIINLCGESVLGRWSSEKMESIERSRLLPTQFLCDTLLSLSSPPMIYIGASAMGIYKESQEDTLTESSPFGDDFLSRVCQKWEKIPLSLKEKQIRVCLARFGLIIGKEGGMLKKILPPFQMGMGGVLGDGKQFVSWAAVDDAVRAIQFMIEQDKLEGPINVVAPEPITNKQMTTILGEVLHRPSIISIPKMMLGALFGGGSQMLLSSFKVTPKKLLDNGFTFQYPNFATALQHIIKT